MISQSVALDQVSRLYDNYSPSATQAIRESKARLVVAELKGFTDETFARVCDLIISESKAHSFPTIEVFKSFLTRVGTQKEYINHQFCDQCGGTGYYNVWEKRRQQWYNFPYRCTCNSVTMLTMPVITPDIVPIKPHNPYKPCTLEHDCYNTRMATV